jgi:exopolysaccharide production protein ExoZ
MKWIKNTFEVSRSSRKSIIPMEGIRGIAVFLVFLVHYAGMIRPWLTETTLTFRLAMSLRDIGNMGVDLFFVLSGFLIYGMLIKKHRSFKKYLMGRIRRIYPTFTVVFVFYLILSAVFPDKSKLPIEWKDSFILIVQNYLLMPGLFDVTAIIRVAWSLSYEFFCYLVIPLLIVSLSLRSFPPRQRMIFFALVTICGFGYFAFNSGPIRLLMFVAGIILHDTIESKMIRRMPRIGIPALLFVMLSAVVLKGLGVDSWWRYVTEYVLFFVFCLECFMSSGFTARVFSFLPLRWLGNMSYSFYLIHGLTLNCLFMVLGHLYPPQHDTALMFWLLLPLAFVIALIPSVVLFALIEKPYSLSRKQKSTSAATSVSYLESFQKR